MLLFHFLLIAIEISLKLQKRAECFEQLASLTLNISLLGYSMYYWGERIIYGD